MNILETLDILSSPLLVSSFSSMAFSYHHLSARPDFEPQLSTFAYLGHALTGSANATTYQRRYRKLPVPL